MMAQHRKFLSSCLFVFVGLLALMLLASGAQTWAAPPSQGSVPPPVGGGLPPNPSPSGCCLPGVAFSSDRYSNQAGYEDIYVMSSNGSKMVRLTDGYQTGVNPADYTSPEPLPLNTDGVTNRYPAPSPDGTRIAFMSSRDDPAPKTCGQPGQPNCVFHLYVMNVDGTGLYQLTSGNVADENPHWSFVYGMILFQSNREDPSPLTCGQPGKPNCIEHVYMVRTDGRFLHKMTTNPERSDLPQNQAPGFNGFAVWSPDDSKIAFMSTRDDPDPTTCDMRDLPEGPRTAPACVKHIYTMNPDGTGVTRLTNGTVQDGHPSWGPNGDKIIFHSNRDGHFRLYTMNTDGSSQLRLTNPADAPKVAGDDINPVWIPGCVERILFSSTRDDGTLTVYAIDSDGNNLIRLTTPLSSTVYHTLSDDNYPAWSGLPDLIRAPGPCCVPGVAFDSTRDTRDAKNPQIYVMRGDGSRVTRVTFSTANDQNPAPSPDGKRIAFESNRTGTYQLYLMNVDGSNLTQLTNLPGDLHNPVWSNDGNRLAFDSDHEKTNKDVCGDNTGNTCRHIYVIGVNGSGLQRLTNNPVTAKSASNTKAEWALKDGLIAFESTRDGATNVYFLTMGDNQVTRMTTQGTNGSPTFSPDTTMIAFESTRKDGQHYHIYVMNVTVDPATGEGGNLVQVTNDDPVITAKFPDFHADDRAPYWCPSCVDRIIFYSNRDNTTPKIYVTGESPWNSAVKNIVRLTSAFLPSADQHFTNTNFNDLNPKWSGIPIWLFAPAVTPPAPVVPTSTPAPTGLQSGAAPSASASWLDGLTAWVGQFLR